MGLRFRETMSGFVSTPEGERQLSFSVEADTPALTPFGGWAPMSLTGTVTLEGVVEEAELQPGSYLEIGLPLDRHLRYQVTFDDEAGRRYRFYGKKTVRFWDLPRSITTLEGDLFRDGEELGPGTLRFSLLDLPSFLASWRPWSAR